MRALSKAEFATAASAVVGTADCSARLASVATKPNDGAPAGDVDEAAAVAGVNGTGEPSAAALIATGLLPAGDCGTSIAGAATSPAVDPSEACHRAQRARRRKSNGLPRLGDHGMRFIGPVPNARDHLPNRPLASHLLAGATTLPRLQRTRGLLYQGRPPVADHALMSIHQSQRLRQRCRSSRRSRPPRAVAKPAALRTAPGRGAAWPLRYS